MLNFVYKRKKILKIVCKSSDRKNIKEYLMLKKISQPSCNISDSVEFILRGARKRRSMALMNANAINADAGIQAKLRAVK